VKTDSTELKIKKDGERGTWQILAEQRTSRGRTVDIQGRWYGASKACALSRAVKVEDGARHIPDVCTRGLWARLETSGFSSM
jgi:hypothetical protein